MNKTDAEIEKALECCVSDIALCFICPYNDNTECSSKLIRNCFDYINRLKAEIENLNIELKSMRGAANSYKAEVERLEFSNEHWNDWEVKCRAIKEVEGKFKKALSEFDLSSVGLPDYDRGYSDCMTAVEDTFDNLVKEMTENEGKE